MNILEVVASRLRSAGYSIEVGEKGGWFENVTLYGMVRIYPSVDELLGSWEAAQEEFLDSFARPIRQAGSKAWNAYSVFLSSEVVDEERQAQLLEIEEDLRATRKIVRSGIRTEEDVTNAIYPLLPLKNVTVLSDADVLDRLREETGIDAQLLASLESSDHVEQHLSYLKEMAQ